VLLLFSIYWCFRYTRLANKLEIRDLRPAKSQVIRDLKLGLIANIGSMAIAVLIAMARVGELTFKMLAVPQGSTVITPNQTRTMLTQGPPIAASDTIAIQAMVNTIAAGLVGVVVALLLLYLVGQHHSPQERS
jgi:mannose/fructose/N-acetylgalactosamine-specific phosphotransferase system component IID